MHRYTEIYNIIIVSFTFPCQVIDAKRMEMLRIIMPSDARILVQNGDFKFREQRANLILDESIQRNKKKPS